MRLLNNVIIVIFISDFTFLYSQKRIFFLNYFFITNFHVEKL